MTTSKREFGSLQIKNTLIPKQTSADFCKGIFKFLRFTLEIGYWHLKISKLVKFGNGIHFFCKKCKSYPLKMTTNLHKMQFFNNSKTAPNFETYIQRKRSEKKWRNFRDTGQKFQVKP